ncbi:MAG: CehA/McbA family metallohydrolase [Armatimonadetes bacterium]|nr:CehA/McbA family metallohydrolase [Armatimonadota bacterium]
MDATAFDAEGNWYRGNLHTHTTVSDGDLTPGEMCEVYREAGYDFLYLTDHHRVADVSGLSDADFLALPGAELSGNAGERICDLLSININELPDLPHNAPANDVIAAVRELGGEVILAHPYDLLSSDVLRLDGILGLEVYNHSVHMNVKRGFAAQHWDAALARGRRLLGFATDDAHYHFNDFRPNDVCGGWIVVKAPELTGAAILDSIRAGMFYASTGPAFESIELRDETVYARTAAPCRSINFVGPTWGASRSFTPRDGSLISEAEFELREDQVYVRVECAAPDGSMAWTQPLWVE